MLSFRVFQVLLKVKNGEDYVHSLQRKLYQTVVPVKLKFKKEVIQFFVGKFLIFPDSKQINCQVTLCFGGTFLCVKDDISYWVVFLAAT